MSDRSASLKIAGNYFKISFSSAVTVLKSVSPSTNAHLCPSHQAHPPLLILFPSANSTRVPCRHVRELRVEDRSNALVTRQGRLRYLESLSKLRHLGTDRTVSCWGDIASPPEGTFVQVVEAAVTAVALQELAAK